MGTAGLFVYFIMIESESYRIMAKNRTSKVWERKKYRYTEER